MEKTFFSNRQVIDQTINLRRIRTQYRVLFHLWVVIIHVFSRDMARLFCHTPLLYLLEIERTDTQTAKSMYPSRQVWQTLGVRSLIRDGTYKINYLVKTEHWVDWNVCFLIGYLSCFFSLRRGFKNHYTNTAKKEDGKKD